MKEDLLRMIGAGRERELAEIVSSVDDSDPPEPGRWTAKDQLAHLAAWRRVAARELVAARTGGPAPDVSADDDVENAKIYGRTHDLPAAAVRQDAAASWDELAAAVRACSEEDLESPAPRHPERPLWHEVPNNAYFHLMEHLLYWHGEHGDEAAAERAARWGYDLATATFPADRMRGTAAYNLACFYALRGRADEALPLLTDSFALRPDLRAWAREDSDLDLIRSRPEIAELLA